MSLRSFLKKILPRRLIDLRHLWYAWLGAKKYSCPSEELLVIGVTGTSGKSTTVWFLRQLLEAAGYTVGALSTIDFSIAGERHLNDKKMTMLGKMEIQRYLRSMVDAGCDVAIIETTSEGRLQHRHRFINYDTMILTNLYPEHIEAHGGFQKYKRAKLDIFAYVANSRRKILAGNTIPKTAIVRSDFRETKEFLEYNFDTKITFGPGGKYTADSVRITADGLSFSMNGTSFRASVYGAYNVDNILAVIATGHSLHIAPDVIGKAVESFRNAPGRIEFLPEAKKLGFGVVVDYAFEPKAIAELYKAVALQKPSRIIHVFGSTGGGRDIARRFTVGSFVGSRADICIVTNEDPYDDDPKTIMRDVASAAQKVGKKEGETLFLVLDRKQAIEQAIQRAKPNDLVLITGKGSEQAMCIAGGKKIPWDDRRIAREAIRKKEH